MKVLDLQCSQRHVFEGWFASESDFLSQLERGLVECPLCADKVIAKRLSAPRLNLGASSSDPVAADARELMPVANQSPLQQAWLELARRIVAQTDDVGPGFAEEARKMHYGEIPERGIRGQATREQTQALEEEGIAVMPLFLPQSLKTPLQ